jgi:hypothetical protein
MCDFNTNDNRKKCEDAVTVFISAMNAAGRLWSNEYGATIQHPIYTYSWGHAVKSKMVIIDEVLYFKVLPNNMEFIPNDSTIYDGYFISDEMDQQNAQVQRCLYSVNHEFSFYCGQTKVNMYI